MKEMLEQFIVDRNLNEVFANLNVISYEEAGEVVGATEWDRNTAVCLACVGILKFTGTRVKSEVSEVCKKFLFFIKKLYDRSVFKIIRGMIWWYLMYTYAYKLNYEKILRS